MPGEFPFEGFGDALVVVLEGEDVGAKRRNRIEVVWRERLALENGEVDFDLVEPARMHREVHQHQIIPRTLQPSDSLLTAVDGTVVDYPEDPPGRPVRLATHDLSDKLIKGFDGGAIDDVSEEHGSVDVPCSVIGAGAVSSVLVLKPHWFAGSWRRGLMASLTNLKAGFFVGRENEVIVIQGLAIPDALIEVKNAACLGSEVRISGKNPAATTPGSNRIF